VKRLLVLTAVLAILLAATPASALTVKQHAQFTKDGNRVGCVLKVHDLHRQYRNRYRGFLLNGVLSCQKGVHPRYDLIEFFFQPVVVSHNPRHVTHYKVHDTKGRYHTSFSANVQCNRKWNGTWNHPREHLERLDVLADTRILHKGMYQAHMIIDLPSRWSC
jgi:hypothetical protein